MRFICGTQDVHKELEAALAAFLGTEDAILYSSCFDANGGLFETLLDRGGRGDQRRAEPRQHRRRHQALQGEALSATATTTWPISRTKLQEADAAGARFKLIATDGVFSMDGIVADLASICDLAERYGALTMVDDSHAVGFVGEHGRGTPEHTGTGARIDILTGTLGKAMGGASGGYVAARRDVVELLRQRSRPYLFSNALVPAIAAASLRVLELLGAAEGAALRERVQDERRAIPPRHGGGRASRSSRARIRSSR